MTDWRVAAAEAVQTFDSALGRPPFPVDAPDSLVDKAVAVLATLKAVVAAGRLKTLDGVAEVTTTLPILCASLKEGTPNHTPCLRLYRPLLLAVAHASALSTYPVSYLLRDAEAVLGSPSSCPPGPSSSQELSTEAEANEVTFFSFMSLTQSLTATQLRRFLRLPATEPPATQSKGGKTNKKVAPPAPAAKRDTGKGETAADKSPVSRALLYAVLEAPLSSECRAVVESFLDNTAKFLSCVGGDGELAVRILDVYSARLVPKLKPSSLLPCLDAPLLDYYVDVVAASQRAGHLTLLSSQELRDVACRCWDLERLERLASTAALRVLRPEEAMPSMLVYTFLYTVFCTLHPPAVTGVSASTITTAEQKLSTTEAGFVVAICKATVAVLRAERVAPPSRGARSSVYAPGKAGLLYVQGHTVPSVAEPLHAFVGHLLARPAAEALWRGGLAAAVPEGEETWPTSITRDVAAALQERWRGVLEDVLSGPPGAEPRADSNKGATAKSKGKQRSTAAAASAGAASASAAAAAGESLPPVPLSELLASCCRSLLFASLLHGAQAIPPFSHSVSSGSGQDDTADDAGEVERVVRAYAYLLQHQSQRLSTALASDFELLLTTALWRWTAAPADTPAATQPRLTAPATISVLEAFTADTRSLIWLSPLVFSSSAHPELSVLNGDVLTALAALWATSNPTLWIAVLRAATAAASNVASTALPSVSGSRGPLHRCLAPVPNGVLVGAVCGAWTDKVLVDVAAALTATKEGGAAGNTASVLVAELTRMCNSLADAQVSPVDSSSCTTLPSVSAARAREGLQRLLTAVQELQATHLAAADVAAQQAQQAERQRVQAELSRARELEAAHRAFTDAAAVKRAAKEAEQLQVQAELERRRAERAAQRSTEMATLQRRREIAMETLRRRAALTRAEAEAARRQRFADYQRRLAREYRVSVFLEHLQLPSSRVMEAREVLRAVLDRISPDDLLEYLVSGKAEVPADMGDDERDGAESPEGDEEKPGSGGNEGTAGRAKLREGAAPHPAAPPTKATTTGPRPTGERRDFWAEVLDSAVPAETSASTTSAPPDTHHPHITAATPDSAPSSTATTAEACYRKHSFHYRVAPLMDLFCYDDGDEFGRVPEVFPTVRLRVASRVWAPSQVQRLGFADLREAFQRMESRGLVRLHDGVAQLTLLGFRYHYPFHAAEGMLEVHLREARERVRAAVEARREHESEPRVVNDVDAGEEAEETEGDETEEEWGEDGDEQQLLPDVEFGI